MRLWDQGTRRIAGAARGELARRARWLLAVSALLLFAAPLITASAWARRGDRGLHVAALFSAAGEEVTAAGTVSGSAIHDHSGLRARLQQRMGSRWLTRATGTLHAHGRVSGYSLSWNGSALGRRERMRVEIVSSRHVLGVSAVRSVMPSSLVSVQSTLRNSAVQPPEADVVSVSWEPSGAVTVMLAKGARVPAVGAALVIDVSAKAPNGVLGIVTTLKHEPNGQTQVTTKPGTLEDAYSSFDAHLNGTLGELSEHASEGPLAKAASVNLDPFSHISFGCDDPSLKASITHNIDLSDLQVNAEVTIPSWGNGYSGPGILFTIGGQPKLGLGVKFSGDEECEASVLGRIPIPFTPLMLEIGPDFTVAASGALGMELEWTPRIFYGFSRFRGEPSNNWETFKNGGRTNFTGDANLTVSLALEAGLSLEGRVGVRGSFGPEITGEASAQNSPPAACLSVNADFAANLEAFANDFFNEWTFNIGSARFGNMQLYHQCTASSGSGSGSGKGSGGSGGAGGSGSSGGGGGSGDGGGSPVVARSVAVGGEFACAILSGGGVDCWGDDVDGQLGDGMTNYGSDVPVAVTGITDATQITAGSDFACAILSGGGVDCWGYNQDGELGNGTTGASDVPVAVTGITDATQITAGSIGGAEFACAILAGGSADCWGSNEDGKLGGGAYTGPEECDGGLQSCSTTPVPVSDITDVTQISAGGESACALLSSGGADCWGSNYDGQLGDAAITGDGPYCFGDFGCTDVPVSVTGLTDATQVSSDNFSACALLSGGEVDCWGDEDSTGSDSEVPEPISDITDATQISVGGESACAILSGGAADCWGRNYDGQLGDGTTSESDVPEAVSGLTKTTQISAGRYSACAMLSGGGVDCWGDNVDGQLGNGETSNSNVPVPVNGNP